MYAKRIIELLAVRQQTMATDDRSSAWILTINNPTELDDECIQTARRRHWKCVGQKEKGADGTPHYQFVVRTGQVRFSAVKKLFPRAHIEPCINPHASEVYCTKEDTRIGSLPPEEGHFPTMNQVYELWWGWLVAEEYPHYSSKTTDCLVLFHPGGEDVRVKDGDALLWVFDKFVRSAIANGERVEVLAVNPQVRSSIKKFGFAILKRTKDLVEQKAVRKTADNPAEEVVSTDPTVDTNNADEESSEEERTQEARSKEARTKTPRKTRCP